MINTIKNQSRTPKTYIPTGWYKICWWQITVQTAANNTSFNVNYKYSGSKGQELNLDADYGIYTIRSNQKQPNYYYDVNNHLYQTSVYNLLHLQILIYLL